MFDEYFATIKPGNPVPPEDDWDWVWDNELNEASAAAIRDYIDQFEDEIRDGDIQKVLVFKNPVWCEEVEFQHEGDYSFQVRFSRTEDSLEWQDINRPVAERPDDVLLTAVKLANNGFLEEASQALTAEFRIKRGLSEGLDIFIQKREV